MSSWLALGALGGCLAGETDPFDLAVSPDATAPTCSMDCAGGCAPGQMCVHPSATSAWNAFCTNTCQTTSDCGESDQRCLDFMGESLPRLCASWESPDSCPKAPATFVCDPPAAACADADTLTSPVSWPINHVCGTERIGCPNGCGVGPIDGGPPIAHCL